MQIIRSAEQLAGYIRQSQPLPGGVLVPTMGALHAGHQALIHQAAKHAASHNIHAGCVVTIFVNPAQFNEPKDYQRYPRVLEEDAAICQKAGAKTVVAPTIEMVYPQGLDTPPPTLPPVAIDKGLEDQFRPGHFQGVAKVLQNLFHMLPPAAAIFGEKDYQQLLLAQALVHQLNLPIEIIPGPTVRDRDALALSSRNRFLSAEHRLAARAIPRALRDATHAPTVADAHQAMHQALAGLDIEYATIRHAQTLETLPPHTPRDAPIPMRALIACRLADTRLLDNAPWPLTPDSHPVSPLFQA